MAWIYLPKTLYQYKREAGLESRFDRYRPSYKQKRRRYQHLFHTFWLFLFLTFCTALAKVSMLAIRPQKFDGLRVNLPLAKSAERIKGRHYLRIWIDAHHRILVNNITAKTYDDFAYLVYDAYLRYPNQQPLLIADVRVNMDVIDYTIGVLRIAGYRKLYFKVLKY
ncbi:hypothetical protein YTPLAS21_21230 [Candidatus Nitrosocosmicus sp.]|nr:hypothetical protein YTPLAS21_21230 [Candidatus Nitrosocosmicus sp.]